MLAGSCRRRPGQGEIITIVIALLPSPCWTRLSESAGRSGCTQLMADADSRAPGLLENDAVGPCGSRSAAPVCSCALTALLLVLFL